MRTIEELLVLWFNDPKSYDSMSDEEKIALVDILKKYEKKNGK